MQSVASTPSALPSNASFSPYRTKVTLACDACRKRRAKCSGTSPCSLCADGGHTCIYDDKPRGRRGPRPRRMLQRVIHDLAPAPSPASDTTLFKPGIAPSTPSLVLERRQSRTLAPAPRKGVNPTIRPPELVDEGIGASDSEEEDDGSSSRDIPSLETWRPALERLFTDDDACWKAHPSASIGLICHLVELFHSHASKHLQDVVPATFLFPALIAGQEVRPLLLAMCANCTRFSAHPAAGAHISGHDAVDAHFATSAQRLLVTRGLREIHHLNHIRTLCVLVEYEASQSRGRLSWAHIGTARGLVQIGLSSPDLLPEDAQALESADVFLSLAERLHSLGQSKLQDFIRLDRNSAIRSPSSSRQFQLLQITSLLIRSQQLSSHMLPAATPRPWMRGSSFNALQSELDEYILTHPGISPAIFEPLSGDETAHNLDAAMTLIMCHCTRVMLNKPFLPVSKTRPGASNEPASRPTCLEFPGAPTLFLMERARRCEASAATICHIARHIISNGGFFSNMGVLGFACMQSAFVLINQLHRGSKPPSARIVELLKFDFLVLAAVRKFHWPARHWLDVLFRAHEQKALPLERSSDVTAVFSNFFTRYDDLEEPCFVPLDPEMPTRKGSRIASQPPAREAISSSSTEAVSWVHKYSNHLSEETDSEEKASPAPAEGHLQSTLGGQSTASRSSGIYHGDALEPLVHEQSTQRAGVALMQLSMGGRDMDANDHLPWPDTPFDEPSSLAIMSPPDQFPDMMGMDLDVESLFGPIPMFDDSPELWASILNGISFPG